MSSNTDKSSFFKNFSTLFVGLVFIQIFNFIFSLILPKYFSPEAFAEFGIFTSFVFIFIEVINAKLDIAVILPKSIIESKEIIDASFTVAIVFIAITSFVIVPIGIIRYKIALFLPLVLLLYGIHQPILVYLNKQGNYLSINIFRAIQVIVTAIFTILLAILNIPHALIIGFILGLLASTLYSTLHFRPAFNITLLKKYWKKYDQFPKYGTWSSLLNNISRNSVPIILVQFFSTSFVGFYSYTTRLLNAPTGMFTAALGQVYFKKASEEENLTLKNLTNKIMLYTFLTGILPTLFILIFGQELFFSLFSGAWIESGKIAQYLVLWYFLGVITSPLTGLLDIRNKLKFEFYFNAILFLFRIAALLIGAYFQQFYTSIFLYALVGIGMNLYLLYYINYKLLVK